MNLVHPLFRLNCQRPQEKTLEHYTTGSSNKIPRHSAGWALPEALRELADGSASGLLQELIEAFRQDTAPRLGLMRLAVAHADAKELSNAAHLIKGSAQQMGADAMASICQKLELAPIDTPAPELGEWLTALEAEFSEVSGAMSLWAESCPSGGVPGAEALS
jgi:HPt (histidine-containing phosphotransfer) domain-containing protein